MLSSEQRAESARVIERWRAEALSTQPLDRETARAAVCAFYQAIGLPARRTVLFLSSPLACHFARALIQALQGDGDLGRGKAIEQLHYKRLFAAKDSLRISSLVGLEIARKLDAGQRLVSALEDELKSLEPQLVCGCRLINSFYSPLKSQVCDLVERELSNLGPPFDRAVDAPLADLLQKALEERPWAFSRFHMCPSFFHGGQDAWLAIFDYGARLGASFPYMEAYQAYALACGWMYPHDKVGLVSDRPAEIHLDAQGRVHCATGMAIRFRDGWGVHAWHGVRVPDWVIEARDFNVLTVESEANVERRRVMLERDYGGRSGFELYLQARNPRVIAADEVHGQPRRLLEVGAGDLATRIVEVINGSAEPDGTRCKFFLGAMRGDTPHEVLAASYGIDPAAYREAVRT
jgi:hypothetical protein